MSRYAPLEAHLRSATPPIEMSFAEIGGLVGELPSSAHRHRQWWENDAGHVQARAWLDAGLRTVVVDLDRGAVTFDR